MANFSVGYSNLGADTLEKLQRKVTEQVKANTDKDSAGKTYSDRFDQLKTGLKAFISKHKISNFEL